MQDQIGGREITGDGKAGIDGLAIQQELIVVPAKAGVDGPIAEAKQILNKSGLLEIGAIGR